MRWLSYLGARYGIALGLALLIAGLVLTVRLAGPAPGGEPVMPGGTGTQAVPATQEHADEGHDLEPSRAPASPSTGAGFAPPDVVAKTFTSAWLRHTGVSGEQWLTGLKPYATAALLDKLKGVDPAGVPAERITGDPVPGAFAGQAFVEYRLPVDSGTLTLRLIAQNGQWRVDTIDWERRR
ncbi:hypothetical protein [Longispora albida]|uniref:hypothetical protein n=1 Tax=Longispora albida TaxID=203523 RepID=UPI000375A4DF|nr:hypothetical protein [Longispora albida]